jgi:hypothetical protein
MSDLKTILDKAMTDPAFGKTLQQDPAAAMKQAGVEPTPDKVAALKSSVDSLTAAHKAFHGGMQPD